MLRLSVSRCFDAQGNATLTKPGRSSRRYNQTRQIDDVASLTIARKVQRYCAKSIGIVYSEVP